jgi:hypothetical protein
VVFFDESFVYGSCGVSSAYFDSGCFCVNADGYEHELNAKPDTDTGSGSIAEFGHRRDHQQFRVRSHDDHGSQGYYGDVDQRG